MNRWIDDETIIDFEVPADIKSAMEECERLNEVGDYSYDNFAEALSDRCKEAVRQGHMTAKQWDIIEWRYLDAQFHTNN